MNLEETKKMIESEIEAGALTKNVRSQIKTYIDQKQNVREGFKETFQPLIESQDAVKASIDSQQNKLINQLQENQLALTEGFDKNKLAITRGFDKMEEIRRSDMQELPGIEAIEQGEYEETEEPKYLISINDLKLFYGRVESDSTPEDETLKFISKEQVDSVKSKNRLNEDKYELKLIEPENRIYKVVKKNFDEEAKTGVVTFDDSDLDKGLLNKKSIDILKKHNLPLSSRIKNRKHEEITLFQNNAEVILEYFRSLLANKAILYTEKGVNKAKALNKNPRKDTEGQIENYNVLGNYISKISKLEIYAKKTGQGIIYFNNPLQLLDRLGLLIGSILAGNNGVLQEFSQIAHLLHQMKVITKKQLLINDLLKKYILNK